MRIKDLVDGNIEKDPWFKFEIVLFSQLIIAFLTLADDRGQFGQFHIKVMT